VTAATSPAATVRDSNRKDFDRPLLLFVGIFA
jgi:hypothetical protein